MPQQCSPPELHDLVGTYVNLGLSTLSTLSGYTIAEGSLPTNDSTDFIRSEDPKFRSPKYSYAVKALMLYSITHLPCH